MEPKSCDQTVLPDSSTLKIGGNAKKEKLKCGILSDFQTVCEDRDGDSLT